MIHSCSGAIHRAGHEQIDGKSSLVFHQQLAVEYLKSTYAIGCAYREQFREWRWVDLFIVK